MLRAEDPYLESDGTQFINTGYLVNGKSKIEVDFAFVGFEDTSAYSQTRILDNHGSVSTMAATIYVAGSAGTGNYTLAVALGDRENGAALSGIWTTGEADSGTRATYCDDRRRTVTIDEENKYAAISENGVEVWRRRKTYSNTNTATYPLGLFGRTTATTGLKGDALSRIRVYGLKIYESGALIRDYRPAIKGGVAGLLDSESGTFLRDSRSSGAGTFATGGDIQAIDDDPYVSTPDNNQTGGWQCLDTGYYVKATTRVELDFALFNNYTGSLSGNGDWFLMAGYGKEGNANRHFNFFFNKNGMGWSYGDAAWQGWTADFPTPSASKDIRRTAVIDNKEHFAAVVTSGFTNKVVTFTGDLDFDDSSLKIASTYGRNQGFTPMKIYGCRIYEDGELVRDFRPCVQDGIAGLKDSLTGRFASCGTRTYGGGIAFEKGDAYIESSNPSACPCIDTGYMAGPDTKIFADWAFLDRSNSPQGFVFETGSEIVGRIYNNGSGNSANTCYSWTYKDDQGDWKNTQTIVITNVRHQATIDAYTGDGTVHTVLATGDGTNYDQRVEMAHTKTCTTSLKIFSNTAGTANFAKMRLYGFKIYEKGELIHDYIPYVKGGTAGLRDAVDGSFLAGMNGRSLFTAGGNIESDGTSTPSDAYVESDGTQCINTKYMMDNTARVEADFQYLVVKDGPAIFGAWNQSGDNKTVGAYCNGSLNFAMALCNAWSCPGVIKGDVARHTAVIDAPGGKLYIVTGTTTNSVAIPNSYSSATKSVRPIALFGGMANDAGTDSRQRATARVYSFRIYETKDGKETLAHEYLPCRKDGVVGFYDTKTGQLMTDFMEGNPFRIGGMGWDGNGGGFFTAPGNVRIMKRAGSATVEAFAPGAVAYRWAVDGETVAEDDGGEFEFFWDRKAATLNCTVTPVYSVGGTPVEGTPHEFTVDSVPTGTVVIVR